MYRSPNSVEFWYHSIVLYSFSSLQEQRLQVTKFKWTCTSMGVLIIANWGITSYAFLINVSLRRHWILRRQLTNVLPKAGETNLFRTEEIFMECTWKSDEPWFVYELDSPRYTSRKKRIKLEKKKRRGGGRRRRRRRRRKKILNAVSRGCKLCTPIHRTGGQVKVSRKTTSRYIYACTYTYVYACKCASFSCMQFHTSGINRSYICKKIVEFSFHAVSFASIWCVKMLCH